MKKRLVALALLFTLLAGFVPWQQVEWPSVSAASEEFAIEGGVLTKYNGSGGDVAIPDGVTKIGDSAFNGCTSLKTVTIPDSVTAIGEKAFYGCSGLTGVTIGSGVTDIGRYAFQNCVSLNNVTVPDAVTSIGSSAFNGCVGLTGITLGSSVETVGPYAFSGCASLTSITLPDSVTSLGSYAFQKCTELKEVTLGNSVQKISQYTFYGCLSLAGIDVPDSVTLIGEAVFMGCSALKSVTVGNGVETIGNSAFSDCKNLTTVTLGSSVQSIGQYAFNGCTGLTGIVIPDAVTSINRQAFYGCTGLTNVTIGSGLQAIGTSAFSGCTGLTNVTIPDAVTTIGENAFYGCTGLTGVTFGSGLQTIGEYAFSGCTGLTGVTISDSVTTIGNYAFSGCAALASVTLGSGLQTIGDRVFEGCGLTSVTIPDAVTTIGARAFKDCAALTAVTVGNGVKTVGDYAFSGCAELSSLTLGNSVQSIGQYAFSGCVKLESITLPNSITSIGNNALRNVTGLKQLTISNSVKTIGQYAVSYCPNLESVMIPNSVTTIGIHAFRNCDSLTSVTIGNGVTTVDDYAFSTCAKLSEVTFGSSVKTIGSWAFFKCPLLTEITIPNAVTVIKEGTFQNCTGLKNITFGSSMKSIGAKAFRYDSGLESITLPDSVKSIGDYAFDGCTGLKEFPTGNGVTSIGQYAFQGCTGLTEAVIGNKVTSIGSYVFQNCSNLKSITIPGSVTAISSDMLSGCTGLEKLTLCDGVKTIGPYAFQSLNRLKEISIPNTVTKIGYYSFRYCGSLTSVTIPDSVTSMDIFTFDGCSSMKSVTLGDGLKAIPDRAFINCTGLEALTFGKSVQSIGFESFCGCKNLENITIPDSVTSISQRAFYECTNLKNVTVGNGVTAINSSTFNNCSQLSSVTLGNAVQSIESYAFSRCAALTNITIPDSVTAIREGAFQNCKALETVIVGDSVTTIEKLAFRYDANLKSITIPASVTSIGNDAFTGCTNLTIYGYAGSYAETYAKSKNIPFEAITVYSVAFDANGGEGAPEAMTKIRGKALTLPETVPVREGYEFLGWSTDSDATEGTYAAKGSYTADEDATLYAVWRLITLSSLTVKQMPDTQTYYIGDTLDTTGLVLTAKYTDRTEVEVTEGFTCDPETLDAGGRQTVTVAYDGGTTTFDVTVHSITFHSLRVKPSKLVYNVGDTLDPTGLTVLVIYSDGSTKLVTEGFTCTPTVFDTAGEQTVTAAYCGKTVTFDVTVNALPVAITVDSLPYRTDYNVGDTFDPDGLWIRAFYEDGSEETFADGFTCSPTAFDTAGEQTVTVSYLGQTATFDVWVSRVLTSVAVKTKPNKLSYMMGDSLETDGLVLTATYNDGFTEDVTDGFLCDPETLDNGGKQTITVTYGDRSATFDVDVAYMTTLLLMSEPYCLEYSVGDWLNTDGIELLAVYSDGSAKSVFDGFTCDIDQFTTDGTQTVTVTYGDRSVTFDVTVNPVVTSLSVKTMPDRLTYTVDEWVDPTGLVLTAQYSNGTSVDVTDGYYCDCWLDTAGKQFVTVEYEGQTAEFLVTVQPRLSDLSVKSYPDKTVYHYGDTLDTTGLVLNAVYQYSPSFDTTQQVTEGFTCYPAELTEVGNQTIAVEYGGQVTYFDVTVTAEMASVEVQKLPDMVDYNVGETLDTTGLVLLAVYTDGSTEEITDGFTCTPDTLTTAGQQMITVTYGDSTASFYVNVYRVLTSIDIKTLPDKLTYRVGETLDTAGLVLTAGYNDGSAEDITDGFICTPDTFDEEGTQTVTVSYGNMATSFDVTVGKALNALEIKQLPDKTTYTVDDAFDPAGLVLTALYADGTSEEITEGFTCTPDVIDEEIEQTVTVSYGGLTADFTVTVRPLVTDLTLQSVPDKLVYNVGDTLDTTGLWLVAGLKYSSYSYGSDEVDSGFTCEPTELNTVGTQTVTVTYGGKTATFDVTVKPLLTSVSVKTLPAKLTYNVGETPDPDGLVLTALYSDGSEEEITDGFTLAPFDFTTAGQQTVTVTYGDVTTTFDVTVNRVLTSVAVKTLPDKQTYFPGDALVTDGLTLTAFYNDGTEEDITEGFTCEPAAFDTLGEQTVTVTFGGESAAFNVNVVRRNPLTITIQPSDVIGVMNDTATFTVEATGENVTYQWYYKKANEASFTKWNRKTSASVSTPIYGSWNGAQFYCELKDADGETLQSDTATLTVETSITQQPSDVTGAVNDTAAFTVKATGVGLSYQWYYKKANDASFTAWNKKTSASVSTPIYASWNGTQLYCTVKDASGFTVQSDIVTLTVAPKITRQPTDVSAALNGTAAFTVKATGAGLTYQWYMKKANDASFTAWNKKTSASVSTPAYASWNGTQFYCVVKDANGVTLQSDTVTLTVAMTITQQPADVSGAVGSTATFTVKATGAGISYQWYYKKANDSSFTAWNKKTAASVSTPIYASWNGAKFYCVVKDNSGKTVQSDTVTLTVSTVPLAIAAQPSDFSGKVNDTATFTVKATGSGLSYQWYYKKANESSFTAWNKKTSASVSTPIYASWNGAQFYCLVKDASGKTVQSDTVTLTVAAAPTAITVQPSDVTGAVGDTATFTVKATGTGLTYQWYLKKANESDFAAWNKKTSASVSTPIYASWNGAQFYCIVKDASGKTVPSDTVTLTVG